MADKEIASLPEAVQLYDDALFPCYVPGAEEPAQKATGAQLRALAETAGKEGASQLSRGATFVPAVDERGTLSWSNDQGLANPRPINIMGHGAYDNLVDNGYFRLPPINSRGLTAYSAEAPAYCINRWKLYGAKLSLHDGFLRYESTENGSSFSQQLSVPLTAGKYYKLQVDMETEAITGHFSLAVDEALSNGTFQGTVQDVFTAQSGLVEMPFEVIEGEQITVALNTPSENSLTAKIYEIRVVPADSADANLGTPNMAVEAQKCLYCFERITAPAGLNFTLGIGIGTASTIYVPLKIAPKRGASAAFTAEMVAGMRYGTSGFTNIPTSVTIFTADWTTGHIMLAVNGTFTAGAAYRFGLGGGKSMDFNSEP